MAPDSQTRKIFLILLSFTLLLTTVSAGSIEPTDDDTTVWLNDQVDHTELKAVCGTDDNQVELRVDEKSEPIDLVKVDEEENYVKVNTSDLKGLVNSDGKDKDIDIDCEPGNDFSSDGNKKFDFRKLTASFNKNTYRGYEGYRLGVGEGGSEVVLDAEVKSGSFDSSNLKVDDLVIDLKSINSETNALDLEVLTSDNSKFGAYYEIDKGDRIEFSEFNEDPELNTSEPWNVEVEDKSYDGRVYVEYENITNLYYDLKVSHLGESSFEEGNEGYKFLREDFETSIDGESGNWFEVVQSQTVRSDGEYRISVSGIPEIEDAGRYELSTQLSTSDGKYKIDSVPVYKSMDFSGTVRDTSRTGVETYIRFTDRFGLRNMIDAQGGTYTERVPPDTYKDLEIRFRDREEPQTTFYSSEVDLLDNEGDIRYEYWHNPSDISIEGVTPVNMMALEFGYPVNENPHARVSFDPEKVNPEELQVYECDNWNFYGQECRTEWGEPIDRSDLSIRYGSWWVEFPINPYEVPDGDQQGEEILMNAYVIGTNADMGLSNSITIPEANDGTVTKGSDITVEGLIVSENDNYVEGVDVEISFHHGDRKVSSLDTVQTDIEGRFIAEGDAPEEPGNYSIKVTADDGNYNSFERTFDNRFETIIKEGIAISADSEVRLTPGEDKKIDLGIQNTGQTDMNNVELMFEGMDKDEYSASRRGFNEVSAGEERTTELTFSLSKDYCDGGSCGSYPQLDISATAENDEGDQFEAQETTIYTQLTRITSGQNDSEESDQSTSETSETNNSDSSFTQSVSDLENATGEFIASQSSLNLALGLIMVFMMVLAGAVKKQDNGSGRSSGSRGDRDGRGGRPRVQKPDVGGSSEVKQVETDQEVDEVDNVVDQIESDDQNVDSQIDAIAGSVVGEEQEDTKVVEVEDKDQDSGSESTTQETLESEEVDVEEKFVCEETGEEFDTKAALKLHRQINGLDN
jgi:hypothetical protein